MLAQARPLHLPLHLPLPLAHGIAFADGPPAARSTWDAFLDMWEEKLLTPSGMSVPLLTAVGNHDVGSNAMSGAFAAKVSALPLAELRSSP